MSKSKRYLLFHLVLNATTKRAWQSEYRFHDKRKWRFDYAFPQLQIAIEIDGGVWTNGRHTRGSGFVKDMIKFNTATELGWSILRYTPDQTKKKDTFEQINRLIELKTKTR